jgi:hypothetical protein
VKRRRSQILEQVRDADPFAASRAQGWSETPEGKAIAERVRAEMSSSIPDEGSSKGKRRRGPLLLAATLATLLAIGASFAVLHRHPATSTVVGCYRKLGKGTATFGVTVRPDLTPAEACAQAWPNWFRAPVPARLTECVVEGGGIGVFPYPASMDPRGACNSIDAALSDSTDRPGG